jgi:hypothetical protein
MKNFALAGFLMGMFGIIGIVAADDKDDPSGTWKWKVKFNDKEFDQTLKIKHENGKVTGTITGGGGKGGGGKGVDIDEGKFKDGEVSFSVTRDRKGTKTTTKYTGKLSGDTIKGSYVREVDGKEEKTDWEAKREKEEKKNATKE